MKKSILLISLIFSSNIILIVFLFGMTTDFTWKVGWTLISCQSLLLLFYNIYQAFNKKVNTDILLFNIALFVFILVDPLISIIYGKSFPSAFAEIDNNYVSNKTGVIVCVYCISFFIGNFLFELKKRNKQTKKETKKLYFSKRLIALFVTVGISPFFFYGSGDLVSNFLLNILARTSGYVAFSSGGLANENPLLILFIQILPAITIILGITVIKLRGYKRLITLIIMLIMMLLFISLGGRGGVVFVFSSILFYYIYQNESNYFPIKKILLFLVFIISILFYQINSREFNQNDSRSALDGSSLNKELAFISENYDEKVRFTDSDNIFKSILYPIPETLILLITNPIPRILWKNKPFDKSFGDYNQLRLGTTGYLTGSNITPTIPGRYYLKYGLIGVLEIGLLIGFLWSYINNKIYLNLNQKGLLLLIPISLSITFFVSARDYAPGKFYPVLFIYIFHKINSYFKK